MLHSRILSQRCLPTVTNRSLEACYHFSAPWILAPSFHNPSAGGIKHKMANQQTRIRTRHQPNNLQRNLSIPDLALDVP